MLELLLIIVNSGINSSYNQGVYGNILLAFFVVILMPMITNKKLSISFIKHFPVYLLLSSGLLYALSAKYDLTTNFITYCFTPVAVFVAGYTITSRNSRDRISKIERCLIAIGVGCAIHMFLNLSINIGVADRNKIVDFFAGEFKATNLGAFTNIYIFALLPYLVVTMNKQIKTIGLFVFFCTVIYAFILGTRTTIYALFIVTVISLFLYLKRHYSGKIRKRTLINWGIAVFGVAIVAWTIYSNNLFNIRTKIESSIFMSRFINGDADQSDAVRQKFFRAGIVYLFEHPMGGDKTSIPYFHNYWLDIGRIAGVVPVILVVVMDTLLVKHMIFIFKQKDIDEGFRYALLGIYLCVLLNYFMEPIMDGYMDLLFRFTLINGMTEGLYDWMQRKTAKTIEPCVPLGSGIANTSE